MARASKVSLFFFHAMNLGTDVDGLMSPDLYTRWIRRMRSGSGYGSGWSRTVLTTEKMAVLAPMPRARAAIATAVNPGVLISRRMEWRRSEVKLLMLIGTEARWPRFDPNLAS